MMDMTDRDYGKLVNERSKPSPGALQRRRQSFLRHTGVGSELLPWSAPPKPPARASCPCEQLELILKPVGTRSSPPRRPVATERRSPAFLSTAAAVQPRVPI